MDSITTRSVPDPLASNRLARFDPHSAEHRRDPYGVYARYRANDPVHWGINMDRNAPLADGGWYVFGYHDVVTVQRDPRFRSSLPQLYASQLPAAERPALDADSNVMLFSDPPDHTRLRSLVSKAWTPQAVQRLAPRITAIAHWLIDQVQHTGSMNVIDEYAFVLPVLVISELLGLPAADRDRFTQWSAMLVRTDQTPPPGQTLSPADQASLELGAYFEQVIAQRRTRPGSDLISGMLAAEEPGRPRLSDDELVAMCILLLVAGHETTVNLIGNGVVALLQHPDQRALLRSRMDELLASAVEEMLRHVGPVTIGTRYAGEDIELGGRTIRKHDLVHPMLDAANHDPALFADPTRFDITRNIPRHLAFGIGIHFCLGAPLARLEAQIAFRTLLTRLPDLYLNPGAVLEPGASELRNWKAIPVLFTPTYPSTQRRGRAGVEPCIRLE